jgi:hypothetical protein
MPTSSCKRAAEINSGGSPQTRTAIISPENTLFAAQCRGEEGPQKGEPQIALYLTRVKLSAWEGIDLPRQWDDPARERDEDPYDQQEPDHVPRPKLLDRASPALCQAAASRHDQRLGQRVGVPCCPSAGLERDTGAEHAPAGSFA